MLIAGRSPLALNATGVLSIGLLPVIDQSLSYIPSGTISAPIATPAQILPILAATLPWNSPAVFKPPI
ncbi:19930_t:CDS:2 [Funneliformis geosporum]|nr:19930_t:CDS:2 [Funneliformis geosporum]